MVVSVWRFQIHRFGFADLRLSHLANFTPTIRLSLRSTMSLISCNPRLPRHIDQSYCGLGGVADGRETSVRYLFTTVDSTLYRSTDSPQITPDIVVFPCLIPQLDFDINTTVSAVLSISHTSSIFHRRRETPYPIDHETTSCLPGFSTTCSAVSGIENHVDDFLGILGRHTNERIVELASRQVANVVFSTKK